MEPSVPEVTPPAPTPPAPTEPVAPASEPANAPAAPEGTPPPEGGTPPADQLFELPDGRKVDAATLQKEWKENFLPDYTRKSQKVAQFEAINNPPKPEEQIPDWKKPDYVPKSIAEVIEIAKTQAIEQIANNAKAESEHVAAVAKEVDGQLEEIRKNDPKVDENALFLHANKYGFRDLRQAHANLQAIGAAALDAEQRTLKNLGRRAGDPVATQPGSAPAAGDAIDMRSLGGFRSAQEFLSRLKNNS